MTRNLGPTPVAIRTALFLLVGLFGPGLRADAAVHVVVPGGAISLQQAIDGAAEGDTLLLKGGKHGIFQIVGKSLTLVGEKDQNVTIDWSTPPLVSLTRSRIASLALGQSVTVRGIDGPFEIVDCQGEVRLEDCRTFGRVGFCDPFSGFGYDATPGFVVTNSPRVSVSRCIVQATAGGLSFLPFSCCTSGAPGLVATNATVALYQTTLKSTDQLFPPVAACASAGALAGGTFLLLDGTVIGNRNLSATSPLRRNEFGNLHIDAEPGDVVLLFTSIAPSFLAVPPYPGVLLGSPILGVFPLGTLPATAVDIPIAFSDIPSPGVAAIDLQIQAGFLPTTGLPVIGPMTVITMLDPSL